MVLNALKRMAALLPFSWQYEISRIFLHRQIRRRSFFTDEKEYALLDSCLHPGDWALDLGANVGYDTMRMSDLVDRAGRVIAAEPMPDTFALPAANARLFEHADVSLLDVAVSDRVTIVGMELPRFSAGLLNYYEARVTQGPAKFSVNTFPIDALALPAKVRLLKVDVERHEMPVFQGMRRLIDRDHPVLIIETGAHETIDLLHGLGYVTERLPGSSTLLCRQRESQEI
jgi:FkbM family methyltransferase